MRMFAIFLAKRNMIGGLELSQDGFREHFPSRYPTCWITERSGCSLILLIVHYPNDAIESLMDVIEKCSVQKGYLNYIDYY